MIFKLFFAIALTFATIGNASAADTMIGPITHICRDVTKTPENAHLTLMWVVGYVSGVNNLSKVDFLKGREMDAIIDHFRDVCGENPDWNVLDAARRVVARLRIETLPRELR